MRLRNHPSDLDALSKELFDTRFISIQYAIGEKAEILKLEMQFFGRNLDPTDYAEIIGAPSDSELRLSVAEEGDQINIYCTTDRYSLHYNSSLVSIEGDVTLSILSCNLDTDAPPGIGTRIIARLTEMGSRLGVSLVMLHAAGSIRSSQFNGYYTWPRLGFNGDISDIPGLLDALEKAGFHGVTDTNELFRCVGGADWWKENGSDIFCFFDLQKDSRSFENLRVYLYQKGVVAI